MPPTYVRSETPSSPPRRSRSERVLLQRQQIPRSIAGFSKRGIPASVRGGRRQRLRAAVRLSHAQSWALIECGDVRVANERSCDVPTVTPASTSASQQQGDGDANYDDGALFVSSMTMDQFREKLIALAQADGLHLDTTLETATDPRIAHIAGLRLLTQADCTLCYETACTLPLWL